MALMSGIKVVHAEELEIDEEIDEVNDDGPEYGDLDQDPEPVQRQASRKQQRTRESQAVVTRRVGNELKGIIEMVAAMWEFTGDHCCSPVLDKQAAKLSQAMLLILKRYPSLLSKVDESDLLTLVVQVGAITAALKPVATAIYTNHFADGGGKSEDTTYFDQFKPYRPETPGGLRIAT